jgi:uncharacterized protein YjbI with pentapeptide repeats
MKTEIHNESWTGTIINQNFHDCIFNELTVRNAYFRNVNFKNVDFKNSYLGFNSEYVNCTFDKCKFMGKYSSLGKPSKFKNCNFIDCSFVGIDLFEGQLFEECVISGKIKNAILKDEHEKIENSQTVFERCDMTNVIFDNVSIYGKSIFKDSILPKKGLRIFKNIDDSLLTKAKEICANIDSGEELDLEIIFRPSLKKGQDPIIFDEFFLRTFFKTDEVKRLFELIVDGHETKISS